MYMKGNIRCQREMSFLIMDFLGDVHSEKKRTDDLESEEGKIFVSCFI